jgi:hypothetical protein
MPCCCSSNIKAAKILGIILAVLYGSGIVYDFTKIPLTKGESFSLVSGFFGLASALILAYGGFTRNSKAMQIYIYSTIFLIILFIAGAVWVVVEFFNLSNSDKFASVKEEAINEACNQYRGTSDHQFCLDTISNTINDVVKTAGSTWVIILVVISVVQILFDIWTIFVAKNAKKEIEAEK